MHGPAGELPPGARWGEVPTPLQEVRPGLWLKMDQLLPTGSFKARGAAAMIGVAAELGVRRVVADSSGNAGRAVAAYAARAGMETEVFVPDSTDPSKVAAIAALGAAVVTVPGSRAAAAIAARNRVETGGSDGDGPWYASHVYQPAFHHGVKTLAVELHDQLAGSMGTVVVPAGNGTLVIGLWMGFRELLMAGRGVGMPRIVAVQARACAPLAGLAPTGPTAAVGIAVASPPRAGEVRAAVLASGGQVVTVGEDDLESAGRGLAEMGVEVEPTSTAVWAAWCAAEASPSGFFGRVSDGEVVLVLTGR